MDFISLLYDFIIGPIELIVNFVFLTFSQKIGEGGIAIVGVSLVINLLALPLYNVADKIQQAERDLQKRLQPRVTKIKKAFKGDEQSMILTEYYRQNGYHPLYSLRNSFSILIQIPFFMAAYNYLSSCEQLQGTAFFFLKNLGEPDSLFTLPLGEGISVNILPIVMTLINVVSGFIYSRGFPLKDKIQIFALAGIFLVLLYNSPSGLVFYWILNNLFSLGKNIVLKMKNPGKILHLLVSLGLIAVSVFFWVAKPNAAIAKKALFTVGTIGVLIFPKFYSFVKKKISAVEFFQINSPEEKKRYFGIFVLSCLVLAVTLGLLLPSSTIGTSPMEFSFLGDVASPTYYIWHCFALMLGLFLLYPLCFYKMFAFNEKKAAYLFLTLTVCVLTNVYIFKHDYGLFNTAFELENTDVLDVTSMLNRFGPIAVLLTTISLIYFAEKKVSKLTHHFAALIFAILLGELALSSYKLIYIKSEFNKLVEIRAQNEMAPSVFIQPVFNLSKTKKNVIVLFIDRGISAFFPYALEEFPELKEAYRGFTYYPNCLSYSVSTNAATSPMLGGYDYTPAKMNERNDVLLVDKHNEALMLMPKLFSDAGYDVVVTDTPWTNYSLVPDFTPFAEKVPQVKTHILQRNYVLEYLRVLSQKEDLAESGKFLALATKTQLPFFTCLQAIYPPLRLTAYDITKYHNYDVVFSGFTGTYSVLYLLPQFTEFSNKNNTYSFIGNETPHESVFMDAPEYTKAVIEKVQIINSSYEYRDDTQLKAYQVNMATFKTIGMWLKYLQDNGAYDNSRIIIVADHGSGLVDIDAFDTSIRGMSSLNPILLIKDFTPPSTRIETDHSLMTNADTLYLATKDLNLSETNPFTGEKLTKTRKSGENAVELHTFKKNNWDAAQDRNKTQFELDGPTYIVKDNIFSEENWTVKE